MTVADLLIDARGRYARAPSHAAYGIDVPPNCVCLVMAIDGAVRSVSDTGERGGWGLVVEDAMRAAVGARELIAWNASHSTEEVLEAFDRAIAEVSS